LGGLTAAAATVPSTRTGTLLRGPIGCPPSLSDAGAAHTTVKYCNIIEAPWLVNGGHGASLRHHTA
jgi:hypothetical protein